MAVILPPAAACQSVPQLGLFDTGAWILQDISGQLASKYPQNQNCIHCIAATIWYGHNRGANMGNYRVFLISGPNLFQEEKPDTDFRRRVQLHPIRIQVKPLKRQTFSISFSCDGVSFRVNRIKKGNRFHFDTQAKRDGELKYQRDEIVLVKR